jgi:hypothetical protein
MYFDGEFFVCHLAIQESVVIVAEEHSMLTYSKRKLFQSQWIVSVP